MKPALRALQFESDLETAAAHYASEASLDTALRFIDAVNELVASLARHPGLGSQQYADQSNPGLRSFGLARFPYVAFFAELDDRVVFWRLLHGERDIPAHLRGDRSDETARDES